MRVRVIIAVAFLWAVAVTAGALTGWPSSLYRDGDFFGFWAGSRSVLEGRDPYDLAWWVAIHAREGSAELTYQWPPVGPRWPSVYPLWTDLAFVPFAALPFRIAAAAWLVSQVTAVLAVVVVLSRLILGTTRNAAGGLALGLAFVVGSYPFWLLIAGGNMTGWLFAIYWGAVACVLTGRERTGGALVGLLLLKPQAVLAAVPAVLAALPRDRVWAFGAGLAVAAGLLVSATAVQPSWIGEWLSAVGILRTAGVSNATLWTLDRVVEIPLAGPAAVGGLGIAVLWWLGRSKPAWLWVVCASIALSVAVAPYGWSYDELLLLPVVLPIITATMAWRTPHRMAMLLAAALVLDVLPWILHAVALRRGGEELNAIVPVLALGLVVLAQRGSGATIR